ncbi:MAG: DUF1553 domain-containing protein, partial [Verrucomicrobia bacterium]|nr:DUF1553 domain-containing protein [Verrucomicrobiota bacterium]
GNLDSSDPKPHPFPPQTDWKFTQHNPFKAVYESRRRSVYLMTQRMQRHPYLAIFDGADPSASTPFRGTSTTPLQALFLMNDKFVHEQSEAFARRIKTGPQAPEARLRYAYQSALGRSPEPEEIRQGIEFILAAQRRLRESGVDAGPAEAQSWQALSRVLFRLNEFVYID